MRKNIKLLGAVAVAGLVAVSGSAFTATSTIDDPAINVGSVAQSVSGATITNVVHAYTASSDTTTSLTAKAEELVSTTSGVFKVLVTGTIATVTAERETTCSVVQTDTLTAGTDDGVDDYSTATCDIADATNVTSIRFVVNG